MGAMSADSTVDAKNSGRSAIGIFAVLALAGVCVLGFAMRCLHLLRDDHYYILSPDSYFFHWQAQRVLSGESIPLRLHGGLTYPLAWMAEAINLVFGTSETQALRWAGLLMPPLLGVFTIVILYVLVSRLYSRRVALFAAFVWATALMPVFIGAAGYLDRDGVSVLLAMVGVLLYYVSRNWAIRVRGAEVGGHVGVLMIAGVEVVLYTEWMYMGPLILLVILVAFWGVEVTMAMGRSLYRMAIRPEADILAMVGDWLRDLRPTLWRSDWRRLPVLLGLNFVAVAIMPGGLGSFYRSLGGLTAGSLAGTNSVSELQGMSLQDLVVYQVFIIPVLLGLYVTLKNGRRADALVVGWFVSLFAIGLFSRRVFFFAAPSICVLSGVGFAYLVDLRGVRLSWAQLVQLATYDTRLVLRLSLIALVVVLILLSLLVSVPSARQCGSAEFVSADNDWEAGMEWLREETPTDARVMTHWNYGYFILDLADRTPVVDNGLYGWDEERNHDIALAYCTTETSEVVSIMKKHNADYFIFSTLEYSLLPLITEDALGESYGDGEHLPREMRDSMYARALSGEFTAGEGLGRVYPEDPSATSVRFVVLGLE
jgi:asparagine N-glycosylation enzyme membrane subunit Stt3